MKPRQPLITGKEYFPIFLSSGAKDMGLLQTTCSIMAMPFWRAAVARSLVASGLLPTLGIFHRNQYNPYCLADDVMEPYRPFVDKTVCNIIRMNGKFLEMTAAMKKELLAIDEIAFSGVSDLIIFYQLIRL